MKIEVNFGKWHLVVLILILGVVGVYAAWSVPGSGVWHDASGVKVNIPGQGEYSLQDAISLGLISGNADYVGLTSQAYNGVLVGEDDGVDYGMGYTDANDLCDAEYSGSRVCTASDFAEEDFPDIGAQYASYTTFVHIWDDLGRVVSDCDGFSSVQPFSRLMVFQGTDGRPDTASCSTFFPFACCR